MAEDVNKKILIDVQLKQSQLKSDIIGLNQNLDQLLVKQLQLSSANKQNTAEYVGLTSQIRLAKAEIRDANKQVDNMSKALNAENNSISQNRALLSVLTAQYVKLSQEQGKTAKSTVDLGKTIDNLSSTLKTQEKQIGQTYREVGNYEQAFSKALGTLGQFVPGLQKFNTAITTVVKGFGFLPNSIKKSDDATGKLGQTLGYMPQQFGNAEKAATNFAVEGEKVAVSTENIAAAAPAAEEGVAGITGAMIGMIAAILAVVALFAVVVGWFAKLTPNAEALGRTMSGVGGAFNAFMSDIGEGVGFGQLFDDMKKAYNEAKALKGEMQDLARETEVVAVANANADAKIADLQLKMRNRRVTPEQEQKYFNEIQAISNESYKQRKDVADKEYDIAVKAAVNGRKFTDQQIADLRRLGAAYAAVLDKQQGLRNKEGAGTDVASIAKAQEDQAAAQRYLTTVQDRAQNRLDARQMKAEQAAEKEAQLLETIKERTLEANNERIASIARMLEFQQESFGKEISATDEHYRQLIFKQEKFIEQQEFLVHSKKSTPKVKAAAKNAIGVAKSDIDQLGKERYAAVEKMLIEHNHTMIQIAEKGALDLRAIEITNIEDSRKRELASIKLSFDKQQEALQEENHNLQQIRRQVLSEISDKEVQIFGEKDKNKRAIFGLELQALKTTLNETDSLISNASDKFKAYQKGNEKAVDDTNKKFDDQNKLLQDQVNIITRQLELKKQANSLGFLGQDNSGFDSKLEQDKIQQAKDQLQQQLDSKGLDKDDNLTKDQLNEKAELVRANEEAIAGIQDNYRNNWKQKEKEAYQEIKNAAFSIIENGIKAQAQAREVQLGKDKERELANSSLTSAQKISINDKYRKLEGQAKVKEFKAEQKLSLARAAIETAESILKASPIIPLMALAAATGAAEIGVIASQKPPAFATGGQYKSDGKGSILPGYSRTDNVNAQLRSGEAVVVSEAMRDPWARNIVSAINVAYGGRDFSTSNPGRGYAIGGIVTDGGNSNRYYAQPQEGTQNLANSIAYSLINNFPPVMVQVKDINSQQAILAKTVNRVNL